MNTLQHSREDIIAYFVGELNPSRTRTGFPPLTPEKLANRLTDIPTHVLEMLRRKVEKAVQRGESPGREFWNGVRA